MTLCSCAGNGQSSNTITNMVTLTGSNCVHPITNLSLITFNATATFTSTCPYLTPINCVVNDWTAWSVDVPCGVNNNPPCAVRSKRNRTITTYPCHGGAQCPVLSDIKNEPCSDTCMFMAPECNNVFECNTVDVCNTTKVCNTFPNTLMHCDNGVSQPCLTTQTIDVTPCSSDCIYNGPLCGTTPCDLNSCMTTTECANYPTNPSYCDNGQSLLCPVNPSGSVDPCSTDCTYYNNAPDCNTGICDPLTCLATRKCSTMPDTVTQCINGASLTCTIYTDTINVSCVTSCIYNDWTAWSAFDTCSPINPQDPQSLCSQSQNRTRTLAAVCPNTVENVASCINVLDNNTMACACTMVPTPLPPPPPQCLTSQDCPTSPALCSEAVCQGGSCYIQLKTCPDLDLCNVGGCDSNTGLCTHTSTVCNDNNPCTSDTCSLVTGECVYTEISAPYNNSCTTYYCNPLTGSGTSTPMVCPPGEYCTQYDPQSLCRPNCVDYTNCTFLKNPNDKCYYGVCAGTQCLLNVNFCFGGGYCDSTTGGCVNTAPCGGLLFCPPGQLANFTTCTCYDDPAQCVSAPCSPAVYNTTSQTCNKTVITNCPSDNNLCTIDPVGCDPILGCSPSRYQSILCPIETCKISSCSPALGCQLTPVICPSDNNSLTNDVCNPFGVCEYNYICDDHNVCTVDSFTNGVCSNIRDATCCYNNSQCASNQCNKANPFNLTGTCAPNIVISGCFGNNTPCIPSDVCATSAGICINGFCTDYSNCNFAVTSFCDSTICTPTGCQYVKSDPKCIGTFSSTTKFCDPFNCADSATHCAVCPNDSQSQLGGLFDLGCTCF